MGLLGFTDESRIEIILSPLHKKVIGHSVSSGESNTFQIGIQWCIQYSNGSSPGGPAIRDCQLKSTFLRGWLSDISTNVMVCNDKLRIMCQNDIQLANINLPQIQLFICVGVYSHGKKEKGYLFYKKNVNFVSPNLQINNMSVISNYNSSSSSSHMEVNPTTLNHFCDRLQLSSEQKQQQGQQKSSAYSTNNYNLLSTDKTVNKSKDFNVCDIFCNHASPHNYLTINFIVPFHVWSVRCKILPFNSTILDLWKREGWVDCEILSNGIGLIYLRIAMPQHILNYYQLCSSNRVNFGGNIGSLPKNPIDLLKSNNTSSSSDSHYISSLPMIETNNINYISRYVMLYLHINNTCTIHKLLKKGL